MRELAPIVLFVYNRPWHTKKTIEALKQNSLALQSDLFIFADGEKTLNDKKIKETREYIRNINGFKSITIVESDKNIGCANSIIAGVSEVIRKYGKIIVLEDDVVTSKMFLEYLNKGLQSFKDHENIGSISGYSFPQKILNIPESYKNDTYLSLRFGSWGWGTWENRWNKVDWNVKDYDQFKCDAESQKLFNRGGPDLSKMLEMQMNGEIDAWDIRFDYFHFKNELLNVRPTKSLTNNIGLDNSGTHCDDKNEWSVRIDNDFLPVISDIKVSETIQGNFRKAFEPSIPPTKYSLKLFLSKVWNMFVR